MRYIYFTQNVIVLHFYVDKGSVVTFNETKITLLTVKILLGLIIFHA